MKLNRTLFLAILLSVSSGAFAQAPPTPANPQAQTAPAGSQPATGCAPTSVNPARGSVTPRDATTGQSSEPLGDKLAKSDGVLCPPANVDPEMRAPTPETGNTPVIPPPGSPGGDPTVRPK
jgi:hypothetical protein